MTAVDVSVVRRQLERDGQRTTSMGSRRRVILTSVEVTIVRRTHGWWSVLTDILPSQRKCR